MSYFAFVLLGVLLAMFALTAVPQDALDPRVARRIRLVAIVGAIAGAYLFELPADLFGWAWHDERTHALRPIGGRTVLGGIAGGWIAVELAKKKLGVHVGTGDRFAMPLAIGLACGRLGCVFAGCCQGAVIDPASTWAVFDRSLGRTPHFPATLLEAWFHAGFALVLFGLMRLGLLRTRLFAFYIASYAAFRFLLEGVRSNPRVLAGCTYYQWLAALLFAAAIWQLSTRRGTVASQSVNAL